mmetsp:Transcript_18814/g.54196  ORF Transcript_18814/g.54196 Transcript_18814/m.54196 type:complete len:185 (-) Transcript_18814:23-577(-)
MDYNAWETQALGGDEPTFLPFHQSGEKGMICRPPMGFGPQEPYVIAKKDEMPPYNVLFAGMHWDKVAQVNDACNCGFTFYIHPSLFSLIFRAPKNSYLPWHIVFGKPHWRQEFVFALIPIFFQEVWRARLFPGSSRVGGSSSTTSSTVATPPCFEMAQRDERASRIRPGFPRSLAWRPSPRRID